MPILSKGCNNPLTETICLCAGFVGLSKVSFSKEEEEIETIQKLVRSSSSHHCLDRWHDPEV